MNESNTDPDTHAAAKCCTEVDQRIRNNPGAAILIAVGTGLAIGLLVRALRPERRPQHRVAQLLEDIERRVRDATAPALRKAGALAGEGAEAVRDGLHTGGVRLGRLFRDGTKKLRHLFP